MPNGTLYIVATPIGNLQDFSPRAQQILRQVAVIAAEDTRHSRPLLQHFGINTPLVALHEHNEKQASEQLVQRLQNGESVALISDAGTPLLSDPGQHLVTAAHVAEVEVLPVSGPCAAISALSAAGFPADQFVFQGFLPAKATARQKILQGLLDETRTLVFYEAPHRILESLQAMQTVFGTERLAALAKELSKLHETVQRGEIQQLIDWLQVDPARRKGEFVVIISGAEPRTDDALDVEAERIMQILSADLPLKQAAKLASTITGVAKNRLYEWGLQQRQ